MSIGLGLFCVRQRPKEKISGRLTTQGRTANVGPKSITRAVYHENLAGVGRLDDFVIPAHLKPRFASFEGKYVEIETPDLGWTEWANGPIVLQDIDDIRPLPPPPVEIDVNVQRTSADEQSVDVVFSFTNTSHAPVTIATNYVQIGFLDYRADLPNRNRDEDSSDISKDNGYTVRQILYGGTPSIPLEGFSGMQFQNYFDGIRRELCGADGHPASMRSDPSCGTAFLLLPKESVPYFWRASVAKPGRRELAIRYSHYVPETRSYIPIRAWKTIDVPLPREQSFPNPLTIRATVTTELATDHCQGDWYKRHQIEGRLINDTGRPRHIFAKAWPTKDVEQWRAETLAAAGLCLPGEVLLYGENGELVAGSVDWRVPDGACTRRTIGPEGIPFRFQVWQGANTRGPPPIDRIEFWTIADAGLEKLTVAKDIPFVEFPEPAWGPTVEGIRCRIRPLRERYSIGDEIRFGFEVESDQKESEVLHPHFDLSYDGQLVQWSGASDWTFPWRNCFFPFRIGLPLRDEVKVTPGRHKLQVTVHGNPGTYTDAKGREYRTFEGTLVSNELEIEVVEASED